MAPSTARCASLLCLLLLGAVAPACSDGAGSQEDDLTSVRAQSRKLTFEGIVYVEPGTSDTQILSAVHKQTQSMFGALRTSDIGVNKRELKGVDPATFVKREVTVIDTAVEGDAGEAMLEVRYKYEDMAVVPKTMSKKSTLKAALLRPDYGSETARILEECTTNDSHAQDFASSLWYVFEPRLSSCQEAIRAEQKLVDAARDALTEADTQVSLVEARRLYLPVTVQLGKDQSNKRKSYPEYDRLYSGGVKDGKLVVSLINGLIDHDSHAGGIREDSGYGEWLDTLAEAFAVHPGYQLVEVEGGDDVGSYTLESGKEIDGLTFRDFIAMEDGSGFPEGLEYDEREELMRLVGERITNRWLTFEAPLQVTIGDESPRDLGIQITTIMGSVGTTKPFKHAIANSDVFLYNGHSQIGFGPLDPKNFSAADFPESYQILFVDGCVSYNYYEADYIPLKEGGTKNLDLITNAVESPAWRSGYALGQFIARLTDGSLPTYLELLQSAEATGSGLRVVDGELDNEYDPKDTAIELSGE
jgi:hypothetical protein